MRSIFTWVVGLAVGAVLGGCSDGSKVESSIDLAQVSSGDDLATPAEVDMAVPSSHPDLATAGMDLSPIPYGVDDGGALLVDAGPDKSTCAGAGVQIGPGALAGYTYSWSPATGLSSATIANPVATPAANTTYTLTVTETATGISGSDSVVVTVNPLPVFSAGADQSTDSGWPVTLGGAPVAGDTYAWTCNRGSCALSSASAAQPAASPLRSTMYTVTATTPAGCSAQSSTNVWVNLHATTVPDGVTTGSSTAGWPSNAKLLVTFDQPVQASTVTTSNVQLTDVLTGNAIPVTLSFDAAASRLYVTPGSGYAGNADYTLTLKGGGAGILSTDATQPSRFPVDDVIDYSTGGADNTAPAVASSVPANAATAVAMNTSVAVTFTEVVDPATVNATNFTVKTTSGGVSVAGALSYDINSATVQFAPTAALAASTQYTVTMNGIADLAGNAMNNVTLSFTTGAAPDTTPPTVTGFTPTGTGVPVTTLVTVTFNEAVDTTTLAAGITLKNTTTMALVPGTTTYDPLTRTATFDPDVDLASLTTYAITVVGVKDLAGNAIAAPGQTSSFTTAKVVFSDDFESGTGKWTLDAPWGLATNTYRSPTHSLADSPGANYAQNASVTAKVTNAVDVTGTATVTVQWQQRIRTSRNKDFFFMEYSWDGTTWTNLVNKLSGNINWATQTVQLASTGKTTLYLRYRLVDNGDGKQFDGAYLDNVVIQTP